MCTKHLLYGEYKEFDLALTFKEVAHRLIGDTAPEIIVDASGKPGCGSSKTHKEVLG